MRLTPFVSVIILNYNARRFLKACLDSVLATDYPDFEVIFVDNGSKDGSFWFVKENYGRNFKLKLVRLKENYGFENGNNIGVRYANPKSKYFVFLNPDTEVDREWLKELIKVMESDSRIGVAQGLILDYYKRNTIQCAGIFMIDFCGWTWVLFKDLNYDLFVKKCNRVIQIFAALGAFMAVKRNVFEDVKFDTRFFFHFDEVDFAWRAWLRGYKVVLVPKSKIYHALAGGEFLRKSKTLFAEYHRNKNAIRMLLKNYSSRYVLLYFPTAFFSMLARALYYAAKGEIIPVMGFVKGFLWNLLNLPDTLSSRLYVQRVFRKVPDDVIKYMMKRLPLSEIIKRMK